MGIIVKIRKVYSYITSIFLWILQENYTIKKLLFNNLSYFKGWTF